MTILPTQTCFDDAIDYFAHAFARAPEEAQRRLRLVHAICLAPEGKFKDQPFAHGWVEEDRQLVIQAGYIEGKFVYYACKRGEHYKNLRVQISTVYTYEELLMCNRKANHFGPWEPSYQALCGGKVIFYPDE